jgi:hypothetical protein
MTTCHDHDARGTAVQRNTRRVRDQGHASHASKLLGPAKPPAGPGGQHDAGQITLNLSGHGSFADEAHRYLVNPY